jgi:hypothetical protein
MSTIFPGVVDYSDDPILPPWYVPTWTTQNSLTKNVAAPANTFLNNLPTNFTYLEIQGTFIDGNGNNIGGYFSFEQSDDLLIQDPSGTYFRVPKRMAGNIPFGNQLGWSTQGSGKVYIQFGVLDVILLCTDQPNAASVTILETFSSTQQQGFVQPTTWVYHVKEYIGIGSRMYDISVPSASSPGPVDINTLVIPNTIELNDDWNRGI